MGLEFSPVLPWRLTLPREVSRRELAFTTSTPEFEFRYAQGLDAPFADVARGHAIAAVIEDRPASKASDHPCSLMIAHLFGQLGLHCLEQVAVDHGRLLPGQNLALEHHLPNVEPVAQQVGQRPAREWMPPTVAPDLRVRTLVTMPCLRRSAMSRLRLPSRR